MNRLLRIWGRGLRFARRAVTFPLSIIIRRTLIPLNQIVCQIELSKKERVQCTLPIRVGFFVVYDSVFPWRRIFELMSKDSRFMPSIVVIPDVARGEKNMQDVMARTYAKLSARYGGMVKKSWDGVRFIDFIGCFDVYAMMNPYKGMTHTYYQISYLSRKGCLTVHSRYFTNNGTKYASFVNGMSELGYLWRYYAESEYDAGQVSKSNLILSRFGRIKPVGRPKMDSFSTVLERPRTRKRIIIAPHHTFDAVGALKVGNFPDYADFFLELPRKYPHVDWVFRPHPLTFVRMILSGRWSEKDKDDYLKNLRTNENVEIQLDGEYFDLFVNSDALIQDCCSFLPEYYYSGHPQCFIFSDTNSAQRNFEKFGLHLLEGTYKAYSKKEVEKFINKVVLEEKDSMKEIRDAILKRELLFNYPKASEAIINDIANSLIGRSGGKYKG